MFFENESGKFLMNEDDKEKLYRASFPVVSALANKTPVQDADIDAFFALGLETPELDTMFKFRYLMANLESIISDMPGDNPAILEYLEALLADFVPRLTAKANMNLEFYKGRVRARFISKSFVVGEPIPVENQPKTIALATLAKVSEGTVHPHDERALWMLVVRQVIAERRLSEYELLTECDVKIQEFNTLLTTEVFTNQIRISNLVWTF